MTQWPRGLRTLLLSGGILLFCQSHSASASPPPDAAATVIKQGGRGAAAFFSNLDASGCISTGVFVIASAESEQILPDGPVLTPQVALVISQFDLCAVAPLLTGNGATTDATIVVAPNLDTATVNATVPVLNLANGTLVNVYVDLRFDATSSIQADNGQERRADVPGYKINTTFHQTFRAASAYGSVATVESELVPGPSVEAMIQNVIVGEVIIASE